MMKKCCKSTSCVASCLKYAVLGIVGIAAAGWVVMCLWNWLLPELFGWKQIGFIQAVGLLALSKILFGKLHCQSMCRSHGHRHMTERFDSMTPEEREKLQAGLRSCCSSTATSDAAKE
jgi:hypothetical protein